MKKAKRPEKTNKLKKKMILWRKHYVVSDNQCPIVVSDVNGVIGRTTRRRRPFSLVPFSPEGEFAFWIDETFLFSTFLWDGTKRESAFLLGKQLC